MTPAPLSGRGRTLRDRGSWRIRVLQGRGVGGEHRSTIRTSAPKRTPLRDSRSLGAQVRRGRSEFERTLRAGAALRDRSSATSPVSKSPKRPCETRNNEILRIRAARRSGWRGGAPQATIARRLPAERLLRAWLLVRREAERPQGDPAAGGRGRCAHLRRRRSRPARARRSTRHGVHAVARGRRRQPSRIDRCLGARRRAHGSAVGSAALTRRSGLPDPESDFSSGVACGCALAGPSRDGSTTMSAAGAASRRVSSAPSIFRTTISSAGDERVWIVPAFAHPVGAAATLRASARRTWRR